MKIQKYLFPLIVAVIVVLSSTLFAQKSPVNTEKLKQAEQLADKFVERFAETLDFRVCYKEFFVKDNAIKKKCVINQSKPFLDESIRNTTDEKIIENIYLSYLQNFYLGTLFVLNIKNVFEVENDEMLIKKLPLGMRKTALKDFRHFANNGQFNFKTTREIQLFIRQINKLQILYKKYLPKKPFTNAIFQKNIKEFNMGTLAPSFDYEGEVYTVIRGMFYIFIVEENKEFKVLGVANSN